MTSNVTLTEYEPALVALGPEDIDFLRRDFTGRFVIEHQANGTSVLINPMQHVGVLGLPSGRSLQIQPKVPIVNLLYMLGVAYDQSDPFLPNEADTGTVDDILPVVAWFFVRQLERLITKGLLRGYQEQEDNLYALSGRISFAEDIRENHVLRHRVVCRFSELVWDIQENRVIRQVLQILLRMRFQSSLRQKLMGLDDTLSVIIPGNMAASDINRFTYHRLNQHYRPIHDLCRLLLDLLSPSERGYGVRTSSFLIDMNQLFEKYVTRTLNRIFQKDLRVTDQYRTWLDFAGEVAVRPDIVVSGGGEALFIADCKYKRLAIGGHRHSDLYQIVSYCTALNVTRGMLIYPRHLTDIDSFLDIRSTTLTIHEISVNLSGSVLQMQKSMLMLAESITGAIDLNVVRTTS